MYLVGLTGGIGSGKSTVAARLEELGAKIIDADAAARVVVAAGTPGFDEVVARFGQHLVGADGELDRAALAAIVFEDEDARADLNAIVHPRVGAHISQQMADLLDFKGVVVVDVPLLVESNVDRGYRAILVVVANDEVRVARIVQARDMSADDVRARIAAQASDEERLAVATHPIDNDGSLDDLHIQVDRIYEELQARAEAS